jgi:hypothetical protein
MGKMKEIFMEYRSRMINEYEDDEYHYNQWIKKQKNTKNFSCDDEDFEDFVDLLPLDNKISESYDDSNEY